ncbi:MAG: hypothetical protein ACI4QT_02730 [Kiritimatiellia bacterium]
METQQKFEKTQSIILPEICGMDPDELCRVAYERMETDFMGPHTHLIYACAPSQVTPASKFRNGLLFPELGDGYGEGMEDTAIVGGVALSMLVDWHAVTSGASLPARAKTVFEGLRGLVTAHGRPGFVARGLCEEDGKSLCALSSRDQVTHVVHGLWRYWRSALSGVAEREETGRLLTAIATRMEANCTPENDYDFLRADGSRDTRGIQRMWNCNPHEMGRLPMVYLATWVVTGHTHWKELYDGLIDEALDSALRLTDPETARRLRPQMPEYALLQMQSCQELLLAEDPDESRRARIRRAMEAPAEMGAERAVALNGGNSQWLCGAGESLLAQLYVPGRPFSAEMAALLMKSLGEPPLPETSSCRIIHLAAAYWRWRRNQQERC